MLILHVAVSHYMMLYFLLLLQKCMVISVVVVHAFAFCVSRILFCRMENVFLGLYDVYFNVCVRRGAGCILRTICILST